MASGCQPLRCEAQSGVFVENFFQSRPICNVHFAEQIEVGDDGEAGLMSQGVGSMASTSSSLCGSRRKSVEQSTSIVFDPEALEKTANQLLMSSKQPGLKHFGRRVVVALAGQFSVHPYMALGASLSLENDRTKLSACGEHLKTGAIGGFIVGVEILKDFGRRFVGESLQEFRELSWPGPAPREQNPNGKTRPSQARREFDTRRQSRLYPAQ